jgi:hypothetical protein
VLRCGHHPVLEDGEGRPLQVGRKRRSISASLMRVLAKRDPTCAFPGCTTRVFLEGHHVQHWADGGETAIDNLCRLCHHHHRFVHEYGYALSIVDGVPRFRDACGRDVPAVPSGPLSSASDFDANLGHLSTVKDEWEATTGRPSTTVPWSKS